MVSRQVKRKSTQIPLALQGYRCFVCGFLSPQKETICTYCQGVHTSVSVRETAESEPVLPKFASRAKRASLISAIESVKIATGYDAWNVALDGGLVRPSSLLVCGDPGIGKSTQAIAIAGFVADLLKEPVLYGSAEMPNAMFAHVARNRLNMQKSTLDKMFVTDTSDLAAMLADIEEIQPCLVVWDSMQRFRHNDEEGDIVLRRVVHDGIEASKNFDHVAMFISQVTKAEDFSGKNSIRHDVDCEVWLNAVKNGIAVQVPTKNRYGRTPLTGVVPVDWVIPVVEEMSKK